MMPDAPTDLIAEARRRWKRCAETEDGQRVRILAAKKFRAGEHWDPKQKRIREGDGAAVGAPRQPARPCLVVDRLSQPCRAVSNVIKNANFGFDVLPNGGGADIETAEILKGYLRRVQMQARGESPIEWAADQAIEGGLGWFRLRTDYVHDQWEGDLDPALFDQELRMERITNNLAVYCDPSANKPTRSDAQFIFIVEDLAKDEFRRRYPKADLQGLEEFQSVGDMPGWVSQDTIRIAEYWRIEYETRTFHELQDGSIQEADRAPEGTRRTRAMRVPHVKCDKINAVESLEPYEWLGSRIPIIPELGEELNVDGAVVLRGIIEEGMDAQRMVNFTYSGAIELFTLEPKSPWVAAIGQIEQFKPIWDTANIYNYSYLPYQHVPDVPMPMRTDRRADGIQAAVELMRISEEAIKATTSTGDASLGNSHPNERSGRALQALQSASDLANSNYPNNVQRALIYAAELMVEVIPKITRPGQIVQIIGLDDEPQQVMVGKPFQEGPNGVPQPAPDHVTPELAKLKESLYKFYDFKAGKYAVTVTVGKATATKREEGAAALGELIPHLPPEMAAVATPDYIEQLSFPGAQRIAERLRKTLPPQLQEQEDQQGQGPSIPPQVQAVMQQMQQRLQQAEQFIQTKQAEQQGQVQQAQIKAQADVQRATVEAHKDIALQRMRDATSIAVAKINALAKGAQIEAEAEDEAIALAQEQAHDVGMAAMEQAHARELAAQQPIAPEPTGM